MNKSTLALAISLTTLSYQASAAGFIEDSTATLSLRNFYFSNDNRESQDEVGRNAARNGQQEEWGQAFQLNYNSGFTQGSVGFGLDAIALVGIQLDAGGNGKAGSDRTPGALFPRDSDGAPWTTTPRAG